MSHLDLIGSKKRKRGERVFRFKSFGEPGYPVEFTGSFRENVKALVEFGHLESNSSWSFQLEFHRHHPVQILLFVVEEPVEASLNRHCNHCQYVGNVIFIRAPFIFIYKYSCNKKVKIPYITLFFLYQPMHDSCEFRNIM